ncbi:MAG: hypothetical protein A2186_00605 [Candidatus Levybacteria bacterium RIFOXYA1_FULL_41_10]|nr:MAG: hypothetical protein A2695_02730 [Candidatus Levybacteria bacterium RIFCSPHIGHO2_01_FULL_40_83]OGH25637.1 MAG: hypothetical protein A3D82_02160 [Candidatus Levybacteria bacterium RIFCSPHIGHO2_02_FULL_40_29]OGH32738.1 MAG: hypothetical protein A3E70_02320 [Candidatus Levybacteria bacterium RIFCSPHIGHO2_12_FULL_40_44]OGH41411.1 MAG: hypothetical protein A2965_02475 [Candidatus Levybacteria bacterium RIFCSPLOWO2_01_FULL_40_96]OGH50549.1 MAG: hypothetical protein A3J18_00085 [Candidatus Lev
MGEGRNTKRLMKISAVIIARNEEEMIRGVLESVKFCDEIIVIDNDSTDNTHQIAKDRGAKVFKTEVSDFSKLRNFGMSKASLDWLFFIDSDERVSDELREGIKSIVSSKNPPFRVYKVSRKNYYFGNNEWPKVEKMERFFRKGSLSEWQGEIHESPVYDSKTGLLPGYLLHFTHRNLSQMLNKTIEWSDIEARKRFQGNHPKIKSWRIFRVMLTSFLGSYIGQKGWKAGATGLVESIYQSFSAFVTYAKLWELQQKKDSQPT